MIIEKITDYPPKCIKIKSTRRVRQFRAYHIALNSRKTTAFSRQNDDNVAQGTTGFDNRHAFEPRALASIDGMEMAGRRGVARVVFRRIIRFFVVVVGKRARSKNIRNELELEIERQ